LVAKKHVLRYLKGTIDYGIRYVSYHEIRLKGYTDSDWASSVTDQKSTSGCCFNLGYAMILWFNMKQTSVVLSTAEVEYITVCSSSNEAMWVKNLLVGLFDLEVEATYIWCDN
jgi:hypothetical protein